MGISYRDSGVSQSRAEKLIKEMIAPIASTNKPWVISGVGGFSALFSVPSGYKEPIFAITTDNVGTKVMLAQKYGFNFNVGIDVVAMNVNDLLCVGAEPIVFLDYIAMESLDENVYKEIIRGIVEGCRRAGCSLIGGETAQVPGMYRECGYDLAGFAVGIIEKGNEITGRDIKPGDIVVGLTSSGVHSNGFSLIRKLLDECLLDDNEILADGRSIIEILMEPTVIYVEQVRAIRREGINIKGVANITGGGFYSNIPRILPEGLAVKIYRERWKVLDIFNDIQRAGNIDDNEMFSTFNMGVGMVIIIDKDEMLNMSDLFIIGEIMEGSWGVEIV
ncbi:MAG: phosphoribosylformylglycinamidine cyclo-ligase [bacterium]